MKKDKRKHKMMLPQRHAKGNTEMVVFYTPIGFLPSTTFITPVALTKANNSKLATLPATGSFIPLSPTRTPCLLLVRATRPQKYVYPDPIPEFAIHETKKFREELKKKLHKERDTFGDDLDRVVDTCTELFSEFLHTEYGGPGTLTVEPFTNMLIELKKIKLPGASSAARASLLWAQNYLDHDWQIWNSKIK